MHLLTDPRREMCDHRVLFRFSRYQFMVPPVVPLCISASWSSRVPPAVTLCISASSSSRVPPAVFPVYTLRLHLNTVWLFENACSCSVFGSVFESEHVRLNVFGSSDRLFGLHCASKLLVWTSERLFGCLNVRSGCLSACSCSDPCST